MALMLWASEPQQPNTLFVKIERLRRLHRSDQHIFTVRRGEDGTFGIGLSDDNEVTTFYHSHRAHVTSVAICSGWSTIAAIH